MTSSYVIDTIYNKSFVDGSTTFRKSIIDIGLSIYDNIHLITTIKPSIECDKQKDALIQNLITDFEEQKQRSEETRRSVINMKNQEIEMIKKSYEDQLKRYDCVLESERLEQDSKLKSVLDERENYVNNLIALKNAEVAHLLEFKEHQSKLQEKNQLLIDNLQEQVITLTQNIESTKPSNIVRVGQIGEETVYNYISTHFTEGILANTSKQGGQGDLHYTYKDMDVLIEVKNKDRITSDDIIKFIRDVKENTNIVGGVFVSIKQDVNIPCHSAYDIEWLDDKKPIIYVNQFENLPEMLYVAIKSIIFYLDATQVISNEQSDEASSELQNLKTELRGLTSTISKFFPIIDEAVKSSKRSYESLEMLKTTLKDQFESLIANNSESDLEHIGLIVQQFRNDHGKDPTIQNLVELGIPALKIKKLGGIRKIFQDIS